MTNQIRCPKVITQKDNTNRSSWADLDNIRSDDLVNLASNEVQSKSAPQVICATDFGFKVPDDARVTAIIVEHDFHKKSSQNPIKMDPPMITAVIGDKSFERASFLQYALFFPSSFPPLSFCPVWFFCLFYHYKPWKGSI